jgi:3-isopropylmalate/(R)-2-methylmalate dehydratase small subunit
VWALEEYGIRCVLAPSFADIFFSNCFKNGVLPIVLDEESIEELFQQIADAPGYALRVDLPTQTIERPDGTRLSFHVEPHRKHCLMHGLDDIGMTLQAEDAIRLFEAKHRASQPWLFD